MVLCLPRAGAQGSKQTDTSPALKRSRKQEPARKARAPHCPTRQSRTRREPRGAPTPWPCPRDPPTHDTAVTGAAVPAQTGIGPPGHRILSQAPARYLLRRPSRAASGPGFPAQRGRVRVETAAPRPHPSAPLRASRSAPSSGTAFPARLSPARRGPGPHLTAASPSLGSSAVGHPPPAARAGAATPVPTPAPAFPAP